eukprot:15223-Heterococcus_DN1.PRE.2
MLDVVLSNTSISAHNLTDAAVHQNCLLSTRDDDGSYAICSCSNTHCCAVISLDNYHTACLLGSIMTMAVEHDAAIAARAAKAAAVNKDLQERHQQLDTDVAAVTTELEELDSSTAQAELHTRTAASTALSAELATALQTAIAELATEGTAANKAELELVAAVLAAVTAQSAAKAVQEEGSATAERCTARAAALAASTAAVTEQQGDVRADTERLHGEAASAAETRAATATAAAAARFEEAVRTRAAALQAAAEAELKAETAAVAARMDQMNTDIAQKAQQQASSAKAAEAAFEQVLADKAEEVRRVTVELVELKTGRSSSERSGSQETAATSGRGGRAVKTKPKPKPKRATAGGGSRQRRSTRAIYGSCDLLIGGYVDSTGIRVPDSAYCLRAQAQ